jgi:hypothetical protein
MGQSVTKYGMKSSERLREEYHSDDSTAEMKMDRLFEAVMDVRDMLQGFLDGSLDATEEDDN